MTNDCRVLILAAFLRAPRVPGIARADPVAGIRTSSELECGVLGTDEPEGFVDPKTRCNPGYKVASIHCLQIPPASGVTP